MVAADDFELVRSENGAKSHVQLRVECRFVSYWFAGFRAFHQEWATFGLLRTEDRYYDLLALEVLRSGVFDKE